MFGEEDEEQDLKAFEAALGSLRPRADRLDCLWRDVLAKEAAIASESGGEPQPTGPLSLWERVKPTGPLSLWERAKSTGPLSLWERVRVRALGAGRTTSCTNPSGHRFLCIYCGSDAALVRGAGRWVWPTALTTMTAIAAVLLVMLVTHSERQVAVQGGNQGHATRASSIVQLQANPVAPEKRSREDWLAMGSVPHARQDSDTDETSYLTLRDQVLRDGVESWKIPVSAVVTTARTTESPLSYREQLDRLLKQQGLRGS